MRLLFENTDGEEAKKQDCERKACWRLFSNLYTVMAFEAGVLLLSGVLFVPGLQVMFAVSDLSLEQIGVVGICAFFPTAALQAWKVLRELRRRGRR